MADSGRIGKFSFVCNRNATKIHAARGRQTHRPLKRILAPNFMDTIARWLKSMTKSS